MQDNLKTALSDELKNKIKSCGHEILSSQGMDIERRAIHHGETSCFVHSVAVAYISLCIVSKLRLTVDTSSLIRGAILHDYFLYDWHTEKNLGKPHGFIHAQISLKNACRDFHLNEIEKDIIARHMFPLNIKPPKYRESYIVTLADKLCALGEVISGLIPYTPHAIVVGKSLE